MLIGRIGGCTFTFLPVNFPEVKTRLRYFHCPRATQTRVAGIKNNHAASGVSKRLPGLRRQSGPHKGGTTMKSSSLRIMLVVFCFGAAATTQAADKLLSRGVVPARDIV